MYLLSGLHGHGVSSSAGASGAPTEWTQGTKMPSLPSISSAGLPIRVMIRMFATTYGESVICTPICWNKDNHGERWSGERESKRHTKRI